jgi:micrococcal nuclease
LKYFLFILASLLLPALFCPTSPVHAEDPIGTLYGIVVSASDGNHITVNNDGTEISVRLSCIDAPVITKIRRNEPWLSKPGQPFAGRAFMALSNKVLHKQVRLEILKMDNHQRAVAVVVLDGRNVNLEMVAEGWAWAKRDCRKHPGDSKYMAAEEQARVKRVGLWSQDSPQPPWEFRKTRKIENRDSW